MGCGPCAGGCGGEAPPAGVFTGVVVAEEREAGAVARGAERSGWTGIDLRGVEVVKLASLWALLARRAFQVETIEEFVPLHEETEDGPWVYRFPAALAQLLADLDATRAGAVAESWAATDELALDGWDAASAGAVIASLGEVARSARSGGKPLLLWMSL